MEIITANELYSKWNFTRASCIFAEIAQSICVRKRRSVVISKGGNPYKVRRTLANGKVCHRFCSHWFSKYLSHMKFQRKCLGVVLSKMLRFFYRLLTCCSQFYIKRYSRVRYSCEAREAAIPLPINLYAYLLCWTKLWYNNIAMHSMIGMT